MVSSNLYVVFQVLKIEGHFLSLNGMPTFKCFTCTTATCARLISKYNHRSSSHVSVSNTRPAITSSLSNLAYHAWTWMTNIISNLVNYLSVSSIVCPKWQYLVYCRIAYCKYFTRDTINTFEFEFEFEFEKLLCQLVACRRQGETKIKLFFLYRNILLIWYAK